MKSGCRRFSVKFVPMLFCFVLLYIEICARRPRHARKQRALKTILDYKVQLMPPTHSSVSCRKQIYLGFKQAARPTPRYGRCRSSRASSPTRTRDYIFYRRVERNRDARRKLPTWPGGLCGDMKLPPTPEIQLPHLCLRPGLDFVHIRVGWPQLYAIAMPKQHRVYSRDHSHGYHKIETFTHGCHKIEKLCLDFVHIRVGWPKLYAIAMPKQHRV